MLLCIDFVLLNTCPNDHYLYYYFSR